VSKLSGSVAVVTGASAGIGAATARQLAGLGATVVAVARRADRLAETVAACQPATTGSVSHVGDVSDRSVCESIVSSTIDRFGRLDIVVNNAGISLPGHATRATVEDAERQMAVNFWGPVYLTTAALPHLLAQRSGSIVNVTSVAGYVPNPGEAAYGATKAALSRWTHGLLIDLAGTGVHAGVLSPGPIATEIWGDDPYHGRMYPPEMVAAGVVRMIDRRIVHLTVPRRYGLVGALYPLVGRPMRFGLRQYAKRHPV
jgi:NAD(P)-dependent dehydrogenase (short-subunit alcohol dehydrogenase family)